MNVASVVLWLHLLAAVAWIGGMLFLATVLAPVTRNIPSSERTELFSRVGRHFVLGPRQVALARTLRAHGDDPEQRTAYARLQRQVRRLAQLNLLLGLVVLFLAVSLRWT